jgi:hypothetical protein
MRKGLVSERELKSPACNLRPWSPDTDQLTNNRSSEQRDVCPRGELQLTYMIDIAFTTEFHLGRS